MTKSPQASSSVPGTSPPQASGTDSGSCRVCAGASCAVCGVFRSFIGPRANPYLIGVLIGVLSWITFLAMGKALGTSTTMVHLSGAAVAVVAPGHVTGESANPYYASTLNPPRRNLINWQFMLVLGLPVGAWIGSRWIGSERRPVEHVPTLWAYRFGPSRAVRYAGAFVGGVILLFGARMAGGCTSGHGISGGLQLAVSSWTFFIAMFAAGVAAAFALFGLKGRNHVDA